MRRARAKQARAMGLEPLAHLREGVFDPIELQAQTGVIEDAQVAEQIRAHATELGDSSEALFAIGAWAM